MNALELKRNPQADVDDLLASIRKAATIFHEIQAASGSEPRSVVIAALWLACLSEKSDMADLGDAYGLIMSRLGVKIEFIDPTVGAHC